MIKPSKENEIMWGRGQWEGTETLKHNTQFKHSLFYQGMVRCFSITSLNLDLGDILLGILHTFLSSHKLLKKSLNSRCCHMAPPVKSSLLFHHFTS